MKATARWHLPRTLLLAGVVGLGGCTAHQAPTLYRLGGAEMALPSAEGGLAVLLGPVSVADYLQRQALLQRQSDGSLTASVQAQWAGSLVADIEQQLLRQLAVRLNSQRLALAPAEPGFVAEAQVLLSITRLDSGPQRPAVLEAHWRMLDRRGQLLDGRLLRLEAPHGGSIAEQVGAQSLLVQQLAEQLATALQTYAKPHADSLPKPAKPRPKPAAPSGQPAAPVIPKAEPRPSGGEVFRF